MANPKSQPPCKPRNPKSIDEIPVGYRPPIDLASEYLYDYLSRMADEQIGPMGTAIAIGGATQDEVGPSGPASLPSRRQRPALDTPIGLLGYPVARAGDPSAMPLPSLPPLSPAAAAFNALFTRPPDPDEDDWDGEPIPAFRWFKDCRIADRGEGGYTRERPAIVIEVFDERQDEADAVRWVRMMGGEWCGWTVRVGSRDGRRLVHVPN